MASRTRLGLVGALAACSLALIAPGPASASAERRLLAEVNEYRAAHGVRPVRASRSLARSAARYGRHMLRSDRFGHQRRVRISRRFRLRGENLAWQPGNRRGIRSVLARWIASPSHRRVLLRPGFTWGGVGREYGRLGRRRATVWVLHMGRR